MVISRYLSSFKSQLVVTLLSCFGLGLGATNVLGAEKIYLDYGPLQFSLSVQALTTFAESGKVEKELKNYARFLSGEQLEKLRQILVTPAELDHVTIAQFLYSLQGEIILKRLGKIIQTGTGQSGFYAIRSALILAAVEEQGLTPLNVIQKFPTLGIKIVSQKGFEVLNVVNREIQATERALAVVETLAAAEITNADSPLYPLKANLSALGQFSFVQQTLTIKDLVRDRTLPVDLYLPETQSSQLLPLVVISHGLGSDRSTYGYLARHLVSYGFAVAVLEHPGSNARQIEFLLSGLAHQVTPPQELLDRPLDIRFLLDELAVTWGEKINLRQVGVIGQSFGAYTSLALAGAQFNLEQLEQDCQLTDNDSVNVSLLLQCLALNLPQQEYNLKDERIVAAIAINPLTSSIFGAEGLSRVQIPVMLISGSDDAVTPALPEQIWPFSWLSSSSKYLALMKKGTHFSTLNESAGSIPVPPQVVGPDPAIAQEYVKALGLAFCQTYVNRVPQYQEYLTASYAQYLSQDLLPLHLIQSLTPEQLSVTTDQ